MKEKFIALLTFTSSLRNFGYTDKLGTKISQT